MANCKVIVDNGSNVAASMIKNIPERNGAKCLELMKFRVKENAALDEMSGVTKVSNIVTNITTKPIRLSHISSLYLENVAPNFHKNDVLIHICNFAWQGEAQWACFTPYQLGIYPVAKHAFSHIDKTISSVGSWSTHKYYPILIIEDKTVGKVWYFEIEASANWSFELGTVGNDGICGFSVDCTATSENNNGFYRVLQPSESFETPSVLYGEAQSFDDAVYALLKYKRAHGKRLNELTVCFNDYMNCLWAMPSREKLLPLIDAAANVGAELFCIDDGWFIRNGNGTDFGDWIENDAIFGEGGLKSIIEYIKSKGMTPGIWLELETAFCYTSVSKIAPDAILTRCGLPIGEERQFLNFGCKAVTDYLYSRVKHLYDMGIRYIKNDYNHSTGIGCDGDGSFAAALMENNIKFFAFIDRLMADMPDLIIENCGSGAMRCDNATLQHFYLQSTSDQEDFRNNPSIIRGMQALMPTEKMGIWSYPFPATYEHRLNFNEAYDKAYYEKMSDGEQTVFNMACAFFGIMTLSGHIEKCDDYNLSLIKKAIEVYKSNREFLIDALPVFIGEQQKLYTEGYSILALKDGNTLRLGIFKNGGENSITFEIPKEFVNGKINEIYPCITGEKSVSLNGSYVSFETTKSLTAAVYEITI